MNRDERRTIKHLPRSTLTWEVALIPGPQVKDTPIEGILFVVESHTELVRAGAAIEAGRSLWTGLRQAFLEPVGGQRGRPRALVCQPALAARLRDAVADLDVEVRVAERLPAVDAVSRSFGETFQAPRSPGLNAEHGRWRAALTRLVTASPWRLLTDAQVFAFEEGPRGLPGTVMVVVGHEQPRPGLVLFPSMAHYREVTSGEVPQLDDGLAVFLDPIGDLTPDEDEECRKHGLNLPLLMAPRAMAIEDGRGRPLTADEEARLLRAVEAVTALCEGDLRALTQAPRRINVRLADGAVKLLCDPGERPPTSLVAGDHACGTLLWPFADRGLFPTVVIKQRKAEATALAARLSRATHIALRVLSRTSLEVRLYAGEVDMGPLTQLADHPNLDALAHGEQLALVISAGGPTRRVLDPKEFVFHRLLPRRHLQATAAATPVDPVFLGPPDQWPKASATLLAFAAAAFGESLESPEVTLQRMTMAATVFSAVSLADHGGDASILDDALAAAHGGGRVVIEGLIETKRRLFGGDPRIMFDVKLTGRGAGARLSVDATLPAGFRRG